MAVSKDNEKDPVTEEEQVSQEEQKERTSWVPELSEDWLAVIIGLGLVLLVWIGAISNVPWPLFGFLK
jgi:hypothetical protein